MESTSARNNVHNIHLKTLWKQQMENLKRYSPRQILYSILSSLVFAMLQGLVLFQSTHQLESIFVVLGLGYGVYMGFAIGLWRWIVVTGTGELHFSKSIYLTAWLYSAFNMFSVAIMAFFSLSISLLLIRMARFPPGAIGFLRGGILVLYALWAFLCAIFVPRRAFRPDAVKRGLEWNIKWAIGIPVFFTAFGITAGLGLNIKALNESLIILAGLFLTIAFVLTSLWAPTFSLLIVLARGGIPLPRDTSYADMHIEGRQEALSQEQRLLRDISRWLEPQENLCGFTIGRHRHSVNIVLILTHKYLRLASVEGGKNIPLSEIRQIEWLGLQSRLKVKMAAPESTVVFTIWGKEWKARAKALVEEWKKNCNASQKLGKSRG